MASPTEINNVPRRASRIQVEKVVPKWIPLAPPTPMPVDLASIQNQMSLGQYRRASGQNAAPPLESFAGISAQPYEGHPTWKGSGSARSATIEALHGTLPVSVPVYPAFLASAPVNASFTTGYHPQPYGPASSQSEFQPSPPSMVTGPGFYSPRPPAPVHYDSPFAKQPTSDFHSRPHHQHQWPVQNTMTDSPRFRGSAMLSQIDPQHWKGTPVTEPFNRASVWSAVGRAHEEMPPAEADNTRDPGGDLQARDAVRPEAMISQSIPSINYVVGGFQPEPTVADPETSGRLLSFSNKDVQSGPPSGQRREHTPQSWSADSYTGLSIAPNEMETQEPSPTQPRPSGEEGTPEKKESGHPNMPPPPKEKSQQPEAATPTVNASEVYQQGEVIEDEDIAISFEKRLSDPYALKDPSRWRPKDYEDYPELKRIQDEHGEQFLGKPRSQAMIPIIRARERIRMAESHHEESREKQKEVDMVGKLCMCLLRRKGASTGRDGNFGPWAKHLREIEGHFGSAIMLTFAFLQWAFLFNCILAIMWIVIIIIPFCIVPPKSFSWQQFSHAGLGGVLQTNGVDLTFLLYGGYSYTEDETHGMAELYATTILLMLVASLIAVASRMIQNLQTGRFESAYKTTSAYPFSTIVFTSWDFHITSHDTATTLRRTIRMEIHQMLADLKDPPIEGFLRNIFLTRQRYLALLVAWPIVLTTSVGITILLAIKDWGINRRLGTNLAQSAILSTVHILCSFLTKYLVRVENWRPRTAEHVLGFKLFGLRMGYLTALFSRLFIMMKDAQRQFEGKAPYAACGLGKSCAVSGYVCCTSIDTALPWGNMMKGIILTEIDSISNKTVPLKHCVKEQIGKCVPTCIENAVGKQLLRLVFTSTLIQNAARLLIGSLKKYALKLKVIVDIEDIALGVVHMQALVWVASCFSPVAPLLALFHVVVTFYSEKMIMMRTCDPAGRQYSVSRSSNVTYGLLTIALFGCTFAVAVVLWNRSGPCGPVPTHSLSEAFDIPLEKLPSGVGLLVRFATSVFLWGSLFALSIVYYLLQRVKLRRASQSLWVTQQELDAQYQKYSSLVLEQNAMVMAYQGPGLQPLYEEEEDQQGGLNPFLAALTGPLPSTADQRQERFRRSLTQRPRS